MSNKEVPSAVHKLVHRNFKTHKGKNLILIAIIVLCSTFYSIFTIITYNEYKNLERYTQHKNGTSADIVINDLKDEQISRLKAWDTCTLFGESLLVSEAENEELGNQDTEIRYADNEYAQFFYSYPTVGNMPQAENEIAIGAKTLRKLGVSPKIGNTVTIVWNKGGEQLKAEFKVVGFWNDDDELETRYIWVSKNFAKSYKSGNTVGIRIDDNINSTDELEKIVKAFDLQDGQYYLTQINYCSIAVETLLNFTTWIALIVVFIISVLMLGSVQQISISGNTAFYGRLKAMGAEEKQIRRVIWKELWLVLAVSLPIGLIIGWYTGYKLVPNMIHGSFSYIELYYNICILIIPAILTTITVFISNFKKIIDAGKIDIEQAFKYKANGDNDPIRGKIYPGFPILFQMSMDNLSRYKKRSRIGIILIIIGLVWISSFYVINISFDENKYLAVTRISDYSLNSNDMSDDAMGSASLEECADVLFGHEGITDYGKLYLQGYNEILPEKVSNRIINYYESNNRERLKYMTYDPVWIQQYNQMKKNGECRYQIWGIDGLVTDAIMEQGNLISGTFNKDEFMTGKFVVAQGISGDEGLDEEEPTYEVGEKILISGKEYEIMAIVDVPYSIKQDVKSSSAGFELSFFLPSEEFGALFPDINAQKLFFNIAEYADSSISKILTKIEQDQGFTFTSDDQIIQQYHNEVFAQNGIEMLVGYALILAGIVQMGNSIFSSIISRKKEFLLMSRIGMTQKQIKIMLILESLICIAISLICSYILGLAIINFLIKYYISSQWAMTYNFSISPMLILTPILIIFAIVLPMLAYRWVINQEMHSQRLKGE